MYYFSENLIPPAQWKIIFQVSLDNEKYANISTLIEEVVWQQKGWLFAPILRYYSDGRVHDSSGGGREDSQYTVKRFRKRGKWRHNGNGIENLSYRSETGKIQLINCRNDSFGLRGNVKSSCCDTFRNDWTVQFQALRSKTYYLHRRKYK